MTVEQRKRDRDFNGIVCEISDFQRGFELILVVRQIRFTDVLEVVPIIVVSGRITRNFAQFFTVLRRPYHAKEVH